MQNILVKTVLISPLFLLMFYLYPAYVNAAVVIQEKIASGNIVEKYENHAIMLDNGEIYHPTRQNLIVSVEVGYPVTLRYVTEDGGKNVFSEFTPGLDSLQNQHFTPGIKNSSSKYK